MGKKSNGCALAELIVVIALLGIIAAIAIPRLTGFKSMAEERACNANRITVERMYSAFLLQKVHNDSIFNQFYIENFDEVCPANGAISYGDGKMECSVHESGSNRDEEEAPEDEVPWF